MYIIRYIYISYVQGTFRKGEAPLGVEDESGEDEEMSCFLGWKMEGLVDLQSSCWLIYWQEYGLSGWSNWLTIEIEVDLWRTNTYIIYNRIYKHGELYNT